MGNPKAQAEYDKLTALMKGLNAIYESNKMPDETVAALRGNVGNSEALSSLEGNLRGRRLKVLSELAEISKIFGGH